MPGHFAMVEMRSTYLSGIRIEHSLAQMCLRNPLQTDGNEVVPVNFSPPRRGERKTYILSHIRFSFFQLNFNHFVLPASERQFESSSTHKHIICRISPLLIETSLRKWCTPSYGHATWRCEKVRYTCRKEASRELDWYRKGWRCWECQSWFERTVR